MFKIFSSIKIPTITTTKVIIFGTSLTVCIVFIAKRYFFNSSITSIETKLTIKPTENNDSQPNEDIADPKTTSSATKSRPLKSKYESKNLSKSSDKTDSNDVLEKRSKSFDSNDCENKTLNKRQTKPKKNYNSNKKRKCINLKSEYSWGSQESKACFYCQSHNHLLKDCPSVSENEKFRLNNSQRLINDKSILYSEDNTGIENKFSNSEFSISKIVYYLVFAFFILLLLNVIYMQTI